MKYLKWFYIVSVVIMIIGAISLIIDNEFDIYSAYALVVFVSGWVLIENKTG